MSIHAFVQFMQDNKAHQLLNVCLTSLVILVGFLLSCFVYKRKEENIQGLLGNIQNILDKTCVCISIAMVKDPLLQCSNFPGGPRLFKAHVQSPKMCT